MLVNANANNANAVLMAAGGISTSDWLSLCILGFVQISTTSRYLGILQILPLFVYFILHFGQISMYCLYCRWSGGQSKIFSYKMAAKRPLYSSLLDKF